MTRRVRGAPETWGMFTSLGDMLVTAAVTRADSAREAWVNILQLQQMDFLQEVAELGDTLVRENISSYLSRKFGSRQNNAAYEYMIRIMRDE